MHQRIGVNVTSSSYDVGDGDTTTKEQQQQQQQQQLQKRRKKRKQKRPMKQRFIQRLLNLGMISMMLLLLIKLIGLCYRLSWKKQQQQQQQQQQQDDGNSEPKFELYTPDAPSCSNPIETTNDVTFTLVTQLSEDRLWMMEYHCQRYQHKMSIAIYTNRTYDEILIDMEEMDCPVDKKDDDIKDDDESMSITISILDSNKFGSTTDYPVNQLRNLAISKVRTTHIIYIDVDFWTSENLYEVLSGTTQILELLQSNPRQALVIPAFQLFRQCKEWKDCRNNNLPHMPYSLSELQHMFQKKRGHIFDPTNKGGHGSTLYKEWMKQSVGSLLEIECLQSNRYEPFVVIRKCHELPPFQIQFSGYGKNKMTWMMQLIRSGYTLSQVGGIYLCHYPHLDSSSRQHWNEAPKQLQVSDTQVRKPKKSDGFLDLNKYKRGQVDQLYKKFRNWLQENVPDRSILKHCTNAQDDDSKLWIDRYNNQDQDQDQQEDEKKTTTKR